jgi:hypothetical protein
LLKVNVAHNYLENLHLFSENVLNAMQNYNELLNRQIAEKRTRNETEQKEQGPTKRQRIDEQ